MPPRCPSSVPVTSGLGHTGRRRTAERFIKTMLGEWAYARPYRSNDERLAALAGWVASYNRERTHTVLADQTPMDVLVSNVRGNHS